MRRSSVVGEPAPQASLLPSRQLPAVWERISGARWFQGKGRDASLRRVAMLPPVVDEAGLRVCHAVAAVDYGLGGSVEYYQLLLARGPGDPGWREAVADPAALRSWARVILEGRAAGPHRSWHLERFAPVPAADGPVRVFAGEQSNTTIEVGDVALIKLFRRLEPGPNLDISTHAALNAADVTVVARLFGALRAEIPLEGGAVLATDLAMICERLPEPTDGWQLVTGLAAQHRAIDDEARQIGKALSDIHAALARAFGTVRLAGDLVADQMLSRLDRAIVVAPSLGNHREQLRAVFDQLRGRELAAQRVHGDFHLGQTLRTPQGWRIIDFEGEPLKPMAERSAPDSPLRDVAGMTRSLHYAAAQSAPDPASATTRRWFEAARSAFLAGYGRVDEKALRAYEADKAVYEAVYETLNRPGWVGIPLGAITAMRPGPARMPDPDIAARKDR